MRIWALSCEISHTKSKPLGKDRDEEDLSAFPDFFSLTVHRGYRSRRHYFNKDPIQ
jgi:hypothetical protein